MLFNSVQFLVFFFIVTATYFALPHRGRWQLLLVASCYFYMVLVPSYILILFFLILVDYTAGLLLDRTEGRTRTLILLASLLANIGTLGIFKYFNFFNANIGSVLTLFGVHYHVSGLSLVLPIGLSFHTFQSMSYVIEVYRRRYPAEHHMGIYALYVLFYPQMVAGPIERPGNLLRQFHVEQKFEYQRVADGLKLMAWGLFKKVVIADRLALLVNHVYDHSSAHQGLPLILATYAFSYQIYCDFSGYSDIAIGAAKVMGINLMKNFDRPYYSKSIGEFWHRWHISLSSWFRDYLYISLGGNRVVRLRWFFNLFIVFLVSGLWHGANWTFVVWGALHGAYLIGSIVTKPARDAVVRALTLDRRPFLRKLVAVVITFHLVTFSWILFRAKSLADAWHVMTNMVHISGGASIFQLGLSKLDLMVAAISILVLEGVHLLQRHTPIMRRLAVYPAWSRWTVYAAAAIVILLFGEFISLDFIYFQF